MRVSGPIAYIALYAALYAAFGAASPFWPKYFETRALTPEQIGIILAAALLVRLLAGPLVGMFADFLQSLRFALAACAGLAAATAVALLWADGFWLLLLVALVQAAALAPTTSLADALSVNAAKPQRAGRPFEYGWIRGSASAAFVCGTLVVGQITSPTDLTRVIWSNAALPVVAAGAAALVPEVAAQSAPHSGASKVAREVRRLLGIAQFRILIVVSALIYGSHAGCGCPGGRGRHHALVDCGNDELGDGACDFVALARIDLRSASSRLHAYDGTFHSRPFGRNRPNSLRVWFRRCDGGVDAVFRIFLCELRGRGVSCDGASLRPRITACLVRLFRAAGFAASHRMSNAVLPAVLQRQDA
jgi:hypothetical protein